MEKAKIITVQVIEARNFLPLLFNITNQFFLVQIGKQSQTTQVIRSTFNPRWNQAFKFEICEEGLINPDEINLEVSIYYVHGLFSKKLIGKVQKAMDRFPGEFDAWFEFTTDDILIRRKLDEIASFGLKCEIHLKISKE